MEIVKEIFGIIISLIVGIILISAFTPLLIQLNQSAFIPLLYIVVIVAVGAGIYKIIKELQ